MDKNKKLESLRKKMEAHFSARKIVFGEGPADAKVMLVGQNPGEEEEKTGRPFVGRSGKFLNKILEKNKILRADVFVSNVVRFKTPENRKPTKEEIAECMPFLEEQIRIIEPKLVVLMGQVAWMATRIVGPAYFETYHPSAAMQYTKARARFEGDFGKISEIVEKL